MKVVKGLVGGVGGIIEKKGKLKEGQPKPRIYKKKWKETIL